MKGLFNLSFLTEQDLKGIEEIETELMSLTKNKNHLISSINQEVNASNKQEMQKTLDIINKNIVKQKNFLESKIHSFLIKLNNEVDSRLDRITDLTSSKKDNEEHKILLELKTIIKDALNCHQVVLYNKLLFIHPKDQKKMDLIYSKMLELNKLDYNPNQEQIQKLKSDLQELEHNYNANNLYADLPSALANNNTTVLERDLKEYNAILRMIEILEDTDSELIEVWGIIKIKKDNLPEFQKLVLLTSNFMFRIPEIPENKEVSNKIREQIMNLYEKTSNTTEPLSDNKYCLKSDEYEFNCLDNMRQILDFSKVVGNLEIALDNTLISSKYVKKYNSLLEELNNIRNIETTIKESDNILNSTANKEALSFSEIKDEPIVESLAQLIEMSTEITEEPLASAVEKSDELIVESAVPSTEANESSIKPLIPFIEATAEPTIDSIIPTVEKKDEQEENNKSDETEPKLEITEEPLNNRRMVVQIRETNDNTKEFLSQNKSIIIGTGLSIGAIAYSLTILCPSIIYTNCHFAFNHPALVDICNKINQILAHVSGCKKINMIYDANFPIMYDNSLFGNNFTFDSAFSSSVKCLLNNLMNTGIVSGLSIGAHKFFHYNSEIDEETRIGFVEHLKEISTTIRNIPIIIEEKKQEKARQKHEEEILNEAMWHAMNDVEIDEQLEQKVERRVDKFQNHLSYNIEGPQSIVIPSDEDLKNHLSDAKIIEDMVNHYYETIQTGYPQVARQYRDSIIALTGVDVDEVSAIEALEKIGDLLDGRTEDLIGYLEIKIASIQSDIDKNLLSLNERKQALNDIEAMNHRIEELTQGRRSR